MICFYLVCFFKYDSAFKAQRLQNWCEPKHFKEVFDVLAAERCCYVMCKSGFVFVETLC